MEAAICSEILLTLNTVSNYLSEFRGLHCGLNYDLPSWHHVICYGEITFLKKKHITSIFKVEVTSTLKMEAPNSHEVLNNHLPENTLG